jgi:hypothetical protein
MIYNVLAGCLLLITGCEKDEVLTPDVIQKTSYFVDVNGNDSNPGTIDLPWATWGKAFAEAKPGVVVYIRGGEYKPGSTWSTRALNIHGTKEAPVQILNYPGEKPILNCEMIQPLEWNFGISLEKCSYWIIKGLEVKNVFEGPSPNLARGFDLKACENITLENCVAHNIGGDGFTARDIIGDLIFHNCDSYSNSDLNYNGETANGFYISCSQSAEISFNGCRAWNCSDDGFDFFYAEGIISLNTCWSFSNGGNTSGDGNGFKLGATREPKLNKPQRIIFNSIAALNKAVGFDQNSANVDMTLCNNVAYGNEGSGYGLGEFKNILIIRNNISYNNGWTDAFCSTAIHDHNSWDSGIVITDADFENLDTDELLKERNELGNLPIINFLHAVPLSDLINSGIDVGLPYSGLAPDIGPFEIK